jgi:hypothetical protein
MLRRNGTISRQNGLEGLQKEKKQLYGPSICARGRGQLAFSKIQFRDKNQPASKPSGRNQAMYP